MTYGVGFNMWLEGPVPGFSKVNFYIMKSGSYVK